MKSFRILLAVALLVAASAALAGETGSISGKVTDASGVATQELRVGELRVFYDVETDPEPIVRPPCEAGFSDQALPEATPYRDEIVAAIDSASPSSGTCRCSPASRSGLTARSMPFRAWTPLP